MDSLETAVGFIWDQIIQTVTKIADQPLLLIPVGIFVAGAGIGLAKRLIGR